MNAGDSGEAVELIRRMGKKITVTCPDNGINCFEADMVSDTALVIGNERPGSEPRVHGKCRYKSKDTYGGIHRIVKCGSGCRDTYVSVTKINLDER